MRTIDWSNFGALCASLEISVTGREETVFESSFSGVSRERQSVVARQQSWQVTRGSLTMPAQAAAVQKGLAADVALLRAAALVPHVEDEVRLLGVAGAALRAGERPDLLQLVAGRARVPVAGALLVAPQMTGLREAFAAVLAAVLALGTFAASCRIVRA